MVRKILSVMCIWVVVQTVHAAQNQIDGLRVWPSPDNTRIVFDMSSAPEFTYFPLKIHIAWSLIYQIRVTARCYLLNLNQAI